MICRLTGLATPVDLDALGRALRCKAGDVRSVLKARGDNEILALLPGTEASTGLDDALAVLEDQLAQVRGVPSELLFSIE